MGGEIHLTIRGYSNAEKQDTNTTNQTRTQRECASTIH